MLINVSSIEVAQEIHTIAVKSDTDKEFLLLMGIYQEFGLNAVLHACGTSKYNRDDLLNLAGKEVLTLNGWIEVISCLPLGDSTRFVAVFSDDPHKAYILDSTGFSSIKRIYRIRDKEQPTPVVVAKRKRGRPRKDTSSKSMKDLIDRAQSDLMTEPDFPLPKKD